MTDTVELTRKFTPPATAPLLSVRNIEVVYDKVILVLRGLSLDVPKGAIVALLGANGAGKSTTLKAISGLLKTEEGEVTRGEILFDGERINGIDPDHIVRRGIFWPANLLLGCLARLVWIDTGVCAGRTRMQALGR